MTYLVLCNKTLAIGCDFKVRLFGKMGLRPANTNRNAMHVESLRSYKCGFSMPCKSTG